MRNDGSQFSPVMILGILLYLWQPCLAVSDTGKEIGTRENGHMWFVFGEAIVSRSDTAFVQCQFRNENIVRKIRDATELHAIKEFVRRRLLSRVNCHPIKPEFGSVEPDNYVSFYIGDELEPENLVVSVPIIKETIAEGLVLGDVLSEFAEIIRGK